MADNQVLEQYDTPEVNDKNETTGNIRVIVYADGRIQAWKSSPGQDPDKMGVRVALSDKELAYAKEIVAKHERDTAQKAPAPRTAEQQRIDAANADVAEAKAREAKAPQPSEPISAPPTQQFIVKSDGSKTENPNYTPPKPDKPEPTITRTRPGANTGPEGQDLGQNRETVTVNQAAYDRQAEQDLFARQQHAEQQAIQNNANLIATQRISADEAWRKTQTDLEKIRLQFEGERNKLTERGQDISIRGQDISAGVTQRGQDLDYQGGLTRDTVQAAVAALPYWIPPSQLARLGAISDAAASRNSAPLSLPPLQAAPLPYNPQTIAFDAAAKAQGQTPPQLAMPGAVEAKKYGLSFP